MKREGLVGDNKREREDRRKKGERGLGVIMWIVCDKFRCSHVNLLNPLFHFI
jgi:hypothetical protein